MHLMQWFEPARTRLGLTTLLHGLQIGPHAGLPAQLLPAPGPSLGPGFRLL